MNMGTAVVTGAGRGIGRTIAQTLVREGFRVALCARTHDEIADAAREVDPGGKKTLPVAVDLMSEGAADHIVEAVNERFGPISLLVNNAGMAGPVGPFWEIDLSEWEACFALNFHAAVELTRRVLPQMVERDTGAIVNVASDSAVAPIAYCSAYGTSKAALVRFTAAVAAELPDSAVSIFAIHPGVVRTPMNEASIQRPEVQRYVPDFCRILAEDRVVGPERAAALVLTLASGTCRHLSGQYITIDDPLSA
jgi:NAD(P)-dependent dehydrogenase (short-subunit alcohol dehydrogenase family)